MPRGMPDWAEHAPQELIDKTLDNAELAVRLGSPSIYDRRGTTIFMDNFDTGTKRWTKVLTGWQNIYPQTINPFWGGYGIAYYDPAIYEYLPYTQISLPFVTQTPIGAEAVFCLTNVHSIVSIQFAIQYAGTFTEFIFDYYANTKVVKIKIHDATFPTIASNIEVPIGDKRWFSMKLVVNPLTGYYVRGRFNNTEIDLSSYQGYSFSNTAPDEITVAYGMGASSAAATSNYQGLAIVTQNE